MTRTERFQKQLACLGVHASEATSDFFVSRAGGNVSDDVATELLLAPGHHVIVGPIGFGKTTELLRIEQRLRASAPTNPLVVYCDPTATPRGMDQLAKHWLIDVCASEIAQRVLAQKLFSSLRGEAIAKTLTQFRPDVSLTNPATTTASSRDLLRDLLKELSDSPVVLVDSVDRTEQYAALAEMLENDLRELSRLGVSVVMTVPYPFVFERVSEAGLAPFDQQHLLFAASPDLLVEEQWLEDLLRIRNREDLFSDAVIHRIAGASGGVPRFVISIARSALSTAFSDGASVVDVSHVRWATDKFRESVLLNGLEPRERDALTKLAIDGVEQRDLVWKHLINKGVVLSASEQLKGLRAHPLIIEYFKREAA